MTTHDEHPVRVGITGCGYWGSKHLRVFNELPGCEVEALCDPSAENVSRQPRGFLPPLVTGDYERFLASPIEAVVIATPAHTHFDLARRALEAGKHVLVEKPFTTSSADALELIAAAEQRGLTLGVGHTYVYHPAVQFLREIVARGELGRLHYVHTARLSFGLLQPDVDVLWDLAPHDLSILLYVLQAEPAVTAARGNPCLTEHLFEVAHLDLDFPSGPAAHVYVSWLEPAKVRRLTFIADEGTIVYNDVAQGEMIRVYNQSIKFKPSNGAGSRPVPDYQHGDITIPFINGEEPLRAECGDFLRCIRSGGRMTSDAWMGLRVVRLLESSQRALRNGLTEHPSSNGVHPQEAGIAPSIRKEPVR